MTTVSDQWAAGSSYEDFMGRWSRQLAPAFLSWLQIPPGTHWLDVGCGTGALTDAICAFADPASVVGCDPAAAFIEFAQAHSSDRRQTFVMADSSNLPCRPGGYGCVTSLLSLNFMPDPAGAIRDMRAVAAKHATLAACVWDYAEGMQYLRLFWDAAATQDPAAATLDEGKRFPLCSRQPLLALFRACGLVEVRCDPLEIPTVFASFDDFWRPLLGETGPAPSYVASLAPERREKLERELRERLPHGTGREITLVARAWAVRGTVN